MRGLVDVLKFLGTLFGVRTTTTLLQIRDGNNTKWITTDEWFREQKQMNFNFNQGVLNECKSKRTIIAIEKA